MKPMRVFLCILSFLLLAAIPARAQLSRIPASLARSPFAAEVEVYSGGITGDSIGQAFNSATSGNYGLRFGIGWMKFLNFEANYAYSTQTRSFSAVTGGPLPTGTALMRAKNLHLFYGNGVINLFGWKHATVYVSPGIGFTRSGGRSMTLVTPLGVASAPIPLGMAVNFNLGGGVKIFPTKHFGVRLDVRDIISGGGTGTLNPDQPLTVGRTTVTNPQQFFGKIPLQNNLQFTVGLVLRII